MKPILLAAAFLLAGTGFSLAETKSFTLTIGDQAVEMDAGESVEVTLPGGDKTTVKLERNPFSRYVGKSFSFDHPSGLAVASSKLADGIEQYLMATAVGTLVIIQDYQTLDPTTLDQMMLQQMTMDGVRAGAKVEQQPTARKLADGTELKGIVATENGAKETIRYEIVGRGKGDEGVLIITRVDDANAKADDGVIGRFWDTLKITE